jgi:hypothetical protein
MPNSKPAPAIFLLDKRAGEIRAKGVGQPEQLLSTRETAVFLGISEQWLEIRRGQIDGGPPFVKLGPGCIRYRLSTLLDWLKGREYASTAHYEKLARSRWSRRSSKSTIPVAHDPVHRIVAAGSPRNRGIRRSKPTTE